MKFTLYTADITGVKANTKYKNKVEVKDTETLRIMSLLRIRVIPEAKTTL